MLMALNSLAAVHTKPTIESAKQTTRFLNYSATYPEVVIEYRKSGMIIHPYSDASYISEPEAQSIAGGFFLVPKSNTSIKSITPGNRPVHVECNILINVMASAMKA